LLLIRDHGAGVDSTDAGLGTATFFSDRENYENNTTTTGEIYLKEKCRITCRRRRGRLAELQANEGSHNSFAITI